jgi:hypothetical protein
MKAKLFAMLKERIAAGGLSAEVGGAQVAEVYQIEKAKKGRDLSAEDAERIAADVGLGRKSMLFRLGNHPLERAGVIDQLGESLKRAEGRHGGRIVPFNIALCRCIAAVAIDELALEMCFTCKGAGQVRDHDHQKLEGKQPMKPCPTCAGAKRWRYGEDERVKNMAKAWTSQAGMRFESEAECLDAQRAVAEQLRSDRLQALINSIEYARQRLLAAERVAVLETAGMCERWAPGDEENA